MTDYAKVISDLPAVSGLTDTALLEVQVGTGSGSSQKATLAQVLALVSSGGMAWSVVSTDTAMAAANGYAVSGARTMTLPGTVAADDLFVIHAMNATVTIASNGNVITGVGSGNNLTIAAGETAQLLAVAASDLRII